MRDRVNKSTNGRSSATTISPVGCVFSAPCERSARARGRTQRTGPRTTAHGHTAALISLEALACLLHCERGVEAIEYLELLIFDSTKRYDSASKKTELCLFKESKKNKIISPTKKRL